MFSSHRLFHWWRNSCKSGLSMSTRLSGVEPGGDEARLEQQEHGTEEEKVMFLGACSSNRPEEKCFSVILASVTVLFIIVVGGATGRQRHTHGLGRISLLEDVNRSSTCPTGWQHLPAGSRCFLYVNMSSSWGESEETCRNRDGHLAALTSDAEVLFIQSRCMGPCWLGARESGSGKGVAWKWTDCHVHWNVSTPLLVASSNCSGTATCPSVGESCLLVSDTGLVREDCAASHPFVCMLTAKGSECTKSTNRRKYFIILVAVICVILATTLTIVVWLLVHRRTEKKRRRRSVSRSSSMEPLTSFRQLTAEELSVATNNFSMENRLRGSTFRGVLSDGKLVAVKKLERPNFQGRKEYLAEMSRIAKLRHPNLVTMIGCCYDHGERYIVYEYMSNGPLDHWLHDPVRRRTLDWRTRMRIAVTAAQGIAYLHDQVKPHVIHRDIKASSILLDEDLNGHLMGVGLANVVPWEAAYERTVVAGTHGYLAPEFVYRNELTTKSDVYSFGVLMLELISGRKPAMPVDVVDWQSIFEWATPLVQSQRLLEILDPSMRSVPGVSQIQRLVDLIYSCTQHVPSMRPRMSYVVHQLQLVDAEDVQEVRREECSASTSNEPALISVQSEIIESLF